MISSNAWKSFKGNTPENGDQIKDYIGGEHWVELMNTHRTQLQWGDEVSAQVQILFHDEKGMGILVGKEGFPEEDSAAGSVRLKGLDGIMHDLKSPINSLRQVMFLFENESLSKEQKRIITYMEDAMAQLLGVVQDLEGFVGTNPTKTQCIDPEIDIFPVLRSMFVQQMVEKGIQLTVNSNLKTGFQMQRGKLMRILVNLIQNSLQYAECKNLILSIYANENEKLIITVEDDGVGMTPEIIQSIYEPYTRNDRNNRNPGGKGLGMYNVKKLTGSLGGDIQTKSEEGGGTKVTMSFHFQACQTEHAKPPTMDEFDFKGSVVLLADDDVVNREIMSDVLKKCKAEVYAFESGRSLYQSRELQRANIVILDIMMDDWDGKVTANELIKRMGPDVPPLFALSGNIVSSNALEYYVIGFDEVIGKPVSTFELLDKIRNHLQNEVEIESIVLDLIEQESVLDHYRKKDLLSYGDESMWVDLMNAFREEVLIRLKEELSKPKTEINEEFLVNLHTWKSSAGTLGFRKFECYCRFFEAKARKNKLEPEDISRLYACYEEITMLKV